MHHPPAVTVVVSPSRWAGRLVLAIGLLCSVQTALFFSRNTWGGWQSQGMLAGCLLALGLLLVFLRRPDTGELQWNGETWQWSGFSANGLCTLQLHLDFQTLMLVSVRQPTNTTAWLWLERSQMPLQWLAVRRAVVHAALAPARRTYRAAGTSSAP